MKFVVNLQLILSIYILMCMESEHEIEIFISDRICQVVSIWIKILKFIKHWWMWEQLVASVINSFNLDKSVLFGCVSQRIDPLIFKDLIYNNYEKPWWFQRQTFCIKMIVTVCNNFSPLRIIKDQKKDSRILI